MNQTLTSKKQLGDKGEAYVARWLQQKGFSILAQNYSTKWGEIDLIVTQGEVIVFVEVKTRKTHYFATSSVVTPSKQRKLIKTAKCFILQNQIVDKVLRFDIATITINNDIYSIDYIPNAFPGE